VTRGTFDFIQAAIGAGAGNRTPISSLGSSRDSRYTTPAKSLGLDATKTLLETRLRSNNKQIGEPARCRQTRSNGDLWAAFDVAYGAVRSQHFPPPIRLKIDPHLLAYNEFHIKIPSGRKRDINPISNVEQLFAIRPSPLIRIPGTPPQLPIFNCAQFRFP
jgi:hypothetical protein